MLLFYNSYVYYVAIFIFGTSVPLKNMIAYTHMMEFLPGKVTLVSGILFFIDGMILVISPIFLMYLTVNTNVFLWCGVGQNVIALAGFLLIYIPESTSFQLEKEKFPQARKDIEYLLKYNRCSEGQRLECLSRLERYETKSKTHTERELKRQREHHEKNQPSVTSKLFSDKLIIHNLAMMILVWFSSSFTFYLLNFLVKYMPGDIYFNSVVSGLSAFAMLFEGTL